MKKTLAILLALIMASSVALVSCNKNEDNTGDDNDDEFVIDFGDGEVNGETNKSTEDGTGENSKGTSKNEDSEAMTTVNDSVYVLYNANIREKASTKKSVDILATAPFGAELKRSAKNDEWSKVTFTTESGTSVSGYVSNELVTTNKKTVTFVKQETVTGEGENQTTVPVVSKLKGTSNYLLRYYPLASGYPHKVTIELGEIGQIQGGTEVTVLEVSEDNMWAKVEVAAGKLNIKNDKGSYGTKEDGDQKFSDEAAQGYVPYNFLEIAGSSSSSGQNTPSAG